MSEAVWNLLKKLSAWQDTYKYPLGACAEQDAASQAKALSQLKGAWAAACTVKDGELIPACNRCGPFLQELGIRDAVALRNQPDMIPLVLMLAGLYGEAGTLPNSGGQGGNGKN